MHLAHPIVLCLFLVAVAPVRALAAEPAAGRGQLGPAVVVAQEVRDRLQGEGGARVIVELRLPAGDPLAEALLPGPAAVAQQRRDIASIASRVLGWLRPGTHRLAHRYESVPFLALEVGPAALVELEAMAGDVKRVLEDRVNQLNLAESVPLMEGDQAWALGLDGTGTVVAIIDSGVEASHPFFGGRVVEEACYSSTTCGRSTTLCPNGLDEQTGPGAAAPCALEGCWHGTHVAGIAAGSGAGAGQSFSGVAPGVGLMAVQVFSRFNRFTDCGGFPPCVGAYSSDVIAALERVYERRSVHNLAAANLSLGGGSFTSACDDEPFKPIIDNLRAAGIAAVAASGNSGSPDAMASPACVSSVVSVASTTKADEVSWFSNVAPFLSLFGPGDGITSSVTGGGFGVASGTSMAAPHVTGAWALLRQATPEASVGDLLAALEAGGVPITDPRNGVTRPRIRLAASLSVILPDRPFVLSVSPPQGATGTTVATTITGSNFQAEATVSLGPGVTVSDVRVISSGQIAATLSIAPGAALGARDVTVTNPGGQSGTKASGFLVTLPPATLTLAWAGRLRDRVGQGSAAVSGDGALDATFVVTMQPGSGPRTVVELELRRSDAGGIWDTLSATGYWVLGAASGPDAPLYNNAQAAVSFPLADGQSVHVFASDAASGLFLPGKTFALRAKMTDGSTGAVSVTIP